MIQYFLEETVKGQFFTAERASIVSQMFRGQYMYHLQHLSLTFLARF